MSREIYLDNSATTRPYDEVIDFVNHISREVTAIHLLCTPKVLKPNEW